MSLRCTLQFGTTDSDSPRDHEAVMPLYESCEGPVAEKSMLPSVILVAQHNGSGECQIWDRRHSKILKSFGLTFSLALCAACTDTLAAPPDARILLTSVTGDAAHAIDGNGHFVLRQNVAPEEITEAQAKQIAAAMWHDVGPLLRPTLEQDRGGTINADALQPCARAYYALSAYSAIPDDGSMALRKAVGSQWLVGLCSGDVEQVVVAVSASATDVRLGQGRIQLLDPGVANFFSMGVPIGTQIPMPPELVADFVAKSTGQRVALVPQLLMRPHPKGAVVALWQITLAGTVRLTGGISGLTEARQTVFAGPANGWAEPALASAQAGLPDAGGPTVIESRNPKTQAVSRMNLTRRPGIPQAFELVSVEGR